MSRTNSKDMPEYLAQRQAARRSERLVQVIALVVACGSLYGASRLVEPINKVRIDEQMVIDPESIKGLPPLETLLAKTATLRALAIDIAFIRSEKLKEEGKYYEAMQLADWICQLAPRFPSIWSFHAWNQAYNISVGTYTPEQRWRWVNNGIKLLRDQGIVYNPKSVALYKELGYIYWHKVGDFMDDHHWSYKKELAVEMELILGPPIPGALAEETVAAFREIAEAPTLRQLIKDDAAVRAFIDDLENHGMKADRGLLAFVAGNLRDDLSVSRYLASLDEEAKATDRQALLVALFNDEANIAAGDRLLAALRKGVLEDELHMNSGWMLHLMEKYGPIDWRTPYGMCLFWSSWGDEVTRGHINLNENDSMNTARFIFFALKNMILRGRMILIPDFDKPNQSFIDYMPDTRFIDALHETYLEVSEAQYGDYAQFREGESTASYRVGHFNFLSDAIKQLYFEGTTETLAKAQHYYDYLRRVNLDEHTGGAKTMYLVPLREFVYADLKEDLVNYKRTRAFLGAMMRRSLDELAIGNAERSAALVARAKEVYAQYMKELGGDGRTKRRKLDLFAVLRRDAVIGYVHNLGSAAQHKARAWRALEVETQQAAWDACEPAFAEICKRQDPPWAISQAFPEPPGMDHYRANPLQELDREDEEISEGIKDFGP